MIHLSGVGAQYHPTERNRSGNRISVRQIERPNSTICGIGISEETWREGRTLMPLDHPDACPSCLRLRERTDFQFLSPIRIPGSVSGVHSVGEGQ